MDGRWRNPAEEAASPRLEWVGTGDRLRLLPLLWRRLVRPKGEGEKALSLKASRVTKEDLNGDIKKKERK